MGTFLAEVWPFSAIFGRILKIFIIGGLERKTFVFKSSSKQQGLGTQKIGLFGHQN